MYQTYGDGLVQHSGDWTVTREYWTDFLASLATAMMADEELVEHLVFEFSRGPRREEIEFAAGVVFKGSVSLDGTVGAYCEKKTRYYSAELKQLTASPAKEHDKRYVKVEPWNDGSPMAIYRMLLPSYAKSLGAFAWAEAIHDWAMATEGQYMQLSACVLEWTKDTDTARQMRDAWLACKSLAEAYQKRCQAQAALGNVTRDLERRKEHAAVVAEVA
jgi:hypothetical protein